ncbi:MAG: hypothetical protein JWN62_3635, partial [Acidimicrobiales bacterium]|nr:hypothetical protein [Acidimicrobiales bacterium]
MTRSITRLAVAVAIAMASIVVGVIAPASPVQAACGSGTRLDGAQLNAVFAGPGLGATASGEGFGGGDYQHAYPLPDGRILWLFQDLYFSNDNNLNQPLNNAAHNAGLIESGGCFTVLGSQGRDFIGDVETIDSRRWFWPLDGEIGADGNLWVYMAEMANPAGSGANAGALPVRTWLAIVDPNTLQQISFAPAPDSGASRILYGWSVASNDQYSYLYGHCYRQFANDVNGPGEFDSTCMPSTYVARVPLGHFDADPEYWNGSGWTVDARAAVPVLTRGAANPMSVQWFGDEWVNATKMDDWWGSTITVDVAKDPQGPWTTVQTLSVVGDRKCSNGCGNYAATLLPWLDSTGKMTIALSNGGEYALWLANGALYRPTFYTVPVPAHASGSAAAAPAFPTTAGTAGFVGVDPVRLVDTRTSGQAFGRLTAGVEAQLDLRAAGLIRGGMPSGATSVALNITAVGSPLNGYVRAYPCASAEPPTSNVNQVVGAARTNAVIVPVGDGRICVRSSTDVDLVVDLNGWLTTTSAVGLQPVAARRLVDTRLGLGGSVRLSPGQQIQVPVVAAGSATTAVSLNVTAVDPSVAGFVTAWPCGSDRPNVSNLNPEPGVTQPNLVNVRVGAGGAVCLYSSQETDLVVDLLAEYRPGATARYSALAPQRLLDTRAQNKPRFQGNLAYTLPMGSIVAAQVNLTATDAQSSGYLTGYPCMTDPWPGTSNVNYVARVASANSALLTNSRGYSCVYSSSAT